MRLKGEGSISYDSKRERWVIAVSVNGKRVYKYAKEEDKAVEKLKELNSKYGLTKIDSNLTLEKYFEEWLFEVKSASLKPRSIKDYQSIFNNHVKDNKIAKMKITEITKTDATRFLNQLARDGKSIQIIKKVQLRLHSCFQGAISDDLLMKNPFHEIVLPKARSNERYYTKDKQKPIKTKGDEGVYNAYTLDEQNKLMEYIKKQEDFYCDFIYIFIIGTGLRLGEVLALNFNDIVDDSVVVRKALQRMPVFEDRKITKWERQIVSTKTESSERVVPIPDNLMKMVKVRILELKKKQLSDPYFDNKNNLLFPNELGDFLNDRRVLRRLKAINTKLELSNVNVHGLRHSYATRLLELKEPIQVISKLLGHKKVEMTQEIYSHVLTNMKEETASKLNQLINF